MTMHDEMGRTGKKAIVASFKEIILYLTGLTAQNHKKP
jgi:hypothetical protein